jgi:hypothetical protein
VPATPHAGVKKSWADITEEEEEICIARGDAHPKDTAAKKTTTIYVDAASFLDAKLDWMSKRVLSTRGNVKKECSLHTVSLFHPNNSKKDGSTRSVRISSSSIVSTEKLTKTRRKTHGEAPGIMPRMPPMPTIPRMPRGGERGSLRPEWRSVASN